MKNMIVILFELKMILDFIKKTQKKNWKKLMKFYQEARLNIKLA